MGATFLASQASLSAYPPIRLSFQSLDLRSQRPEPLIDPLVAALDLADVVDHRVPLGGERRQQHRHPRPDVGALDHLPAQRRRPRDHRAVGVAQHDAGAHADQLVHEKQARLEQLFEHQQQPLALRGDDDRDRHQVRGERGPRAVLEFRHVAPEIGPDAALLVGVDDELRAVEAGPHAEPVEGHEGGAQVVGAHAVDRDGAVRHRGEPEERADLDVVGANRERGGGGPEWRASLDRQRVGTDPVDRGAEAREEPGQVLDVRLARGVADHGRASGGDRGHQGVLGGGHARLIEEDVRSGELARLELVGRADRDLRTQALQREKMRVHSTAADHIAAGWGQADAPETRQHRPREQDRCADPGAQLGVQLARLGARRVHFDRIRRRPRDRRAEVRQQLKHRLDVANVGNVLDAAGPLGEQGGREDGKRRVLVARRADRPFERAPTRYAERRRHRSRKLWGALRARQARANVRRVHPVLALALLAAAGLLATRLPRLALLPHPSLHLDVAIVAGAPLVLVGLLLGPGIELVSRPLLHALAPVIALAIGWIGAVLGARCEWRVVRRIPHGAWALAAVSAGAVFLLVALGAWLLARWVPVLGAAWAPRLPTVLGLAAVAAVSAPGTVTRLAHAVGIPRTRG